MTLQTRIFSKASHLIIHGNLIKDGDRVLVGFSGGKDSYSMLMALLNFKRKSYVKFELAVAIIDSGFEGNIADGIGFLDDLGIKCHVEKTQIYDILKEKFPDCSNKTGKYCFLCSKLRRGALYAVAERLGCNKLALGHNFDDAIETYLLNIFYGSSGELMKPIYRTDDSRFEVIRPLLFIEEKDIISYSGEKGFPIVKQKCPLKKKDSKREYMRDLLEKMHDDNWMLYNSFKNAMYKEYK